MGNVPTPHKNENNTYIMVQPDSLMLCYPYQKSLKRVSEDLRGLCAKITPIKLNRGKKIVQYCAESTLFLQKEEETGEHDMVEGEEEKKSVSLQESQKIERNTTNLTEEILKLKHEVRRLSEEQTVMQEKHKKIIEAFRYLTQHQIDLQTILQMPSPQRDLIVQEIHFAQTCQLPSPTIADLKKISTSQDQIWLQNELAYEKLKTSALRSQELDSAIVNKSRYVSETVLDVNAQLELLKHQANDKTAKRKYSVKKKIFTIKIGEKKIKLKVLSNIQAHLVANTCKQIIQKEQSAIERGKSESTWFYCPILDVADEICQSSTKKYDHFYAYLFNLRRLKTYQTLKRRQFQLRRCVLDSLRPGHISKCIVAFENIFVAQSGFHNDISAVNIKFGKNTKQINPFSCSHYVTSNLEFLLRAEESVWELLDGGQETLCWEGYEVPGGYYASKLLRLITLIERTQANRGMQNKELSNSSISAFNEEDTNESVVLEENFFREGTFNLGSHLDQKLLKKVKLQ
jgi:hypothetical protein